MGDAQNNVFVIDVIIEKVNVSILEKHIISGVKKLHNKIVVWSLKKCLLNVLLKISFFLYYKNMRLLLLLHHHQIWKDVNLKVVF